MLELGFFFFIAVSLFMKLENIEARRFQQQIAQCCLRAFVACGPDIIYGLIEGKLAAHVRKECPKKADVLVFAVVRSA